MATPREIQRALLARGIGVGPSGADGVIGPATRASIMVAIQRLPIVAVPPGEGMTTSSAGRAFLTDQEGLRLKAYRDSVGVWTIGVGHTSSAGAPRVTSGMTITRQQADEILSRDLKVFEKVVNDAVKVPLTQNQFDALVSLAFNIGGGAFSRSTLVKKLNRSDYLGAADAFLSWNKGGKPLRVIPGLTARRKRERTLFLRSPIRLVQVIEEE